LQIGFDDDDNEVPLIVMDVLQARVAGRALPTGTPLEADISEIVEDLATAEPVSVDMRVFQQRWHLQKKGGFPADDYDDS